MREAYNGSYEDIEALRLRFEEFRGKHEPLAGVDKALYSCGQ